MMKSISQQKPSEGLSVDEALQTDPDSDDALSRLKRVEAQLKSLESTARKVQQEIHLDSYKVNGIGMVLHVCTVHMLAVDGVFRISYLQIAWH